MLIEFFHPGNGPSLELSGPSDVFEEANRQFGRRVYDLQLISERPGPITCLSGLRVLPDRTIDDPIDIIDTLIVAGTIDPIRTASPALIDWLKRCSSSARRYGSVCTGAFFLGAAGLLDNKHVTTHWEFAPALAATFPRAIVEPDRIFVRDGSLFTSAGVTAGVDLALALVEEDFGPALALSIARWLVIYLKRPGGQSQFSVQLAAQIASRPQIQRIQQTIRDNPRLDLSVHNLAQQAAMSDRTFARVFRRETGMTPANFVEATRVDAARRLLEETDLPLKHVAPASGFATPAALRRAFRKKLGITPMVYRSRASFSYRG
jgi:transcriptional regulator GlxA family with amidase domain